MAILPTAMPIAMMKLLSIIVPTGSRVERAVPTKSVAVVVLAGHRSPGVSGIWPLAIVAASWVEPTKREIDREGDDDDAERQDQVGDEIAEAAVLDHQYFTLRSM